MSLSRQEIEKAKFTFSIYDFEGNERIDATQLGHALRAMGLNPTLRRISNLGGTKHRNEKLLSIEEFLAIYKDAKQDKEQGSAEEYLECLSSHDKDKSGKLSVTTLSHLLQGYGEEKLDKDEAQQVIEECGQPYEDQVDYRDFVKNLLKGPDIRIPPALLIQQARAAQALEGDGYTEADDAKAAPDVSSQPRAVSRTSVKSSQGDALKSASFRDPEGQPDSDDDITCASEVSLTQGKSVSRNRDSQKSGKNERGASPDISWASEAEVPKGRSSSKPGMEIVDDVSCASEASEKSKGGASRSSAKSRRSITKVS